MCNNVRDFAVPGGNGKLTVGDLIDNISKDFIATKDIEAIYEEYKAERPPLAKKALLEHALGLWPRRHQFGFAATWYAKWHKSVHKSFLPIVPDRGEVAAVEQPSYTKTKHLAEQKAARKTY
ncbi:hypothetical protein BGZ82_010381 [Podila clonocystis]|nr:hypothetical protein BGZ82_010381 [Podila clonocystis]